MRKKRVVLIEPDEVLSEVLIDKFRKADLDVFWTVNGNEGLRLARSEKPDLVVLSPRDTQSSFILLKSLQDDFNTRHIPVVVLAPSGADEEIKKFLELGATDCIVKEQHVTGEIVERIQNFIALQRPLASGETFEERREAPSGIFNYARLKFNALKKHLGFGGVRKDGSAHILFVDDDESARRIYGAWMAEAGFNVMYARESNEGREIARRLHPDIILLDALLPKDNVLGDAFDLASLLKGETETADIPIIFFTSSDFSLEVEAVARFTGITDYIHKGVDRKEFIKKIKLLIEKR